MSIAYGECWFSWYLRRLAERPASAWFVVRNLMAFHGAMAPSTRDQARG
jgi:hypothetical protein